MRWLLLLRVPLRYVILHRGRRATVLLIRRARVLCVPPVRARLRVFLRLAAGLR